VNNGAPEADLNDFARAMTCFVGAGPAVYDVLDPTLAPIALV